MPGRGSSVRVYELLIHTAGSGSTLLQAIYLYESNTGSLLSASLKASLEGGVARAAYEEAGEVTVTFNVPTEIIN